MSSERLTNKASAKSFIQFSNACMTCAATTIYRHSNKPGGKYSIASCIRNMNWMTGQKVGFLRGLQSHAISVQKCITGASVGLSISHTQ